MVNAVSEEFLGTLAAVLPARAFRPLEPRYIEEPRGIWAGRAGAVVAPETVEQMAAVMRAASAAVVPVVPYGGGTGLVGGQVMPEGPMPLVVSLENMSAIRAVYPEENVIVAEAGAVLAEVQAAAEAAGRLFPLSIAAQGSARIGGNLATNAGGVNVLRYGNARDLCLGLEVVLPDGRIWHGLSRLRKDNTGYDIRNLMIGSEGTLGIITAAALKLFARPAGAGTALMVVKDPAAALALLALARAQLGEAVSAFELIDGQGLAFLAEVLPQVRLPYATPPAWMVLVDLGLARGLDPAEALERLFEAGVEAGLVSDGIIARSEAQRGEFWAVREMIPEANRRIGTISSHDISLPLSELPEFVAEMGAEIAQIGAFRINCFGHLGDGNLHYNVFPPKGQTRSGFANMRDVIKTAVHDRVHRIGGSVSAEHGIGRAKTGDLERYGDPVKLALMREIKQVFDPKGIMNPGAMLR